MTEETTQEKSKALTPFSAGAILSVAQVKAQQRQLKELMGTLLEEGKDYSVIPGCGDKPVLLQPGAQKIGLMFGIRIEPMPGKSSVYEIVELGNGHREYRFEAQAVSRATGEVLGMGVAAATTMETKWAFVKKESIIGPLPKEYWDVREKDPKKAQEILGEKNFTFKDAEGKYGPPNRWYIARKERVPHPNIQDQYNTTVKMGYKRLMVGITINVTAASDVYTQDTEEFADQAVDAQFEEVKPEKKPKTKIDIPPNATPFNRTGKSSPKKTESKPTPAPQAKDDLLQTDYQLPEDLLNQDVRKLKVVYNANDPMTDNQKFRIDCLSCWKDLPESTQMSLRLIRMGLKSQNGILHYYTGSQKNRAGLTIRKFGENTGKLPGFDQDIKTLYERFESGCKEIVDLYVELGKSHKDCEDRTKGGREKWATSMFYNLINESNDEGTRNGLTLKEDSFYSIKSAKDFIENEVAMAQAGFKDGEVKTEDMDI